MHSRFYKVVQGLLTKNASRRPAGSGLKISKERQAALNAHRKESTMKYEAALDQAWGKVTEMIAQIAVEHNRSIRHVETDLRLGHTISLHRHSKKNPWNAFFWKKCKEEKENRDKNGTILCMAEGKDKLPEAA
ncbi:hypothetical protein APHAL10511_007966 [Amanita phalloides]|nr:hypothetical protein APHAL10511_007966 [Amanita phalloides]